MHPKYSRWLVKAAWHINTNLSDWVAHRYGWRRFIDDEYQRPHFPWCHGGQPRTEVRNGGMVTKCTACGSLLQIKFSCWEQEGGHMPPEVVKWLGEDLREMAAAEARATG